jgi:hypothetical protein
MMVLKYDIFSKKRLAMSSRPGNAEILLNIFVNSLDLKY